MKRKTFKTEMLETPLMRDPGFFFKYNVQLLSNALHSHPLEEGEGYVLYFTDGSTRGSVLHYSSMAPVVNRVTLAGKPVPNLLAIHFPSST